MPPRAAWRTPPVAPQTALLATFGETLEGPVADIVVRNWGALITPVGAILIHGAFNPQVRSMVLLAAGASKLAFIALVHGGRFVAHQAGIAVAIDLPWVASPGTWWVHGRHAIVPPEKPERCGVCTDHRTCSSHLVSQGVSAPLWTNLPSRTV